jgi:hypothetical protein
MEQFFQRGPRENGVAPQEMRLLSLKAEPYADHRRVKVNAEVTPYQQPPNVELSILDTLGNTLAKANIIENTVDKFSLTLHFKTEPAPGEYTLEAKLHYQDIGEINTLKCTFLIG